MTILLFAAALYVSLAQEPAAPAEARQLLYVVSEPVSMRAEPDAASRPIAGLKPFDLVSGRQLIPGWLRVDGVSTTTPGDVGWIPLSADNVVIAPLEMLRARVFRVQQTNWAERTKLDVVRGRIREGFTANQVQIALGDPLHKELRATRNDVAEAWIYEDRRIVFSHTGVWAIEVLPAR